MKPGRNSPCPCGSGKKYKHCCGSLGEASAVPAESERPEPKPESFARAGEPLEIAKQLHKTGRFDEARRICESVLQSRPDDPSALFLLALIRQQGGNHAVAIELLERSLAVRPSAAAHNNLGNAFAAQGRMEPAIAHYERALALRPDNIDTLNNLGNALMAQRRMEPAIAHYERALALRPSADVHNNLGNALMAQRRMEPAIAHYERALALRPDYAEAHNNMGVALAEQGMTQQVIACYERALALRPDYAEAHSGLLFTLNYMSADPGRVYGVHREYARRWETPLVAPVQPHANDRSPDRRLRIGYVSSDFRRHSVAHYIEPVLENHRREDFEVFCYYNRLQEDEVTRRLKSCADGWRGISNLSNELAAERITDDRIDILVDLNGHTALNRLPVFARKPAPVQITWLGYPNTTGLSAMDYRVTDAFADPVGMTEHLHSEKLLRLPECFLCYKPPREASEVTAPPSLKTGHVTFGSFNNLAKISPAVTTTWAKILQGIPGSRLVLKNSALEETSVRERLRDGFARSGITADRLDLFGHDASQGSHMGRYANIDIALDTFPYNGTTTTCDALWMGVPVVTLAGQTHAGRVGVSLLSNLGLKELVCDSCDDYVATAIRLATDIERLTTWRRELRARMATSPLTDAPRFTRRLEQAFRGVWRDWCFGSSGEAEYRDGQTCRRNPR